MSTSPMAGPAGVDASPDTGLKPVPAPVVPKEEPMTLAKLTRTFAVTTSVAGLMLAFALPVAAHPVGDASQPNCHGQRVSHGASHSPVHGGHGLTPVERRDLAEQIFNEEIANLGEWNKFIKLCLAPPPGGPIL